MATTVFISLHMFRMSFSKCFNLSCFFATAAAPEVFYSPIWLYSMVQIFAVAIPIFIIDCVAVVHTFDGYWSNQLQMTMFEICCMMFIQATLIAYERIRQKPKNLVFRPSDDNPIFKGLFAVNGGMHGKHKNKDGESCSSDEGDGFGAVSSFWPQAEKNHRHEQLKDIMSRVKQNMECNLNEKMDEILKEELGDVQVQRAYESDGGRPTKPIFEKSDVQWNKVEGKVREDLFDADRGISTCGRALLRNELDEEDNLNHSFPGLNPIYDGAAARDDLIIWMKGKAREAAEEERKIDEEIRRKLMFKDMAVAPNDELVDNVFFAVRPAKVCTGAQTRIRVKPGTTRRKRKDGRPIIQSEMGQSIRESATTMRPGDVELLGATNKPLLNTIDPKRGFARS